MTASLEDIITEVRFKFDSLAQRLGLRGPSVARRNTYFQLGYFGDEVGLEILGEIDDFFIYALPFHMQGADVIPQNGTLSDNGVRQMYLQEALDKLHISHKNETEQMKHLGGDYRNCEAMTKVLASLIERTWPEIDKHAGELFPV